MRLRGARARALLARRRRRVVALGLMLGVLVLVLQGRGVHNHVMKAGQIRDEVADYSCHGIATGRVETGGSTDRWIERGWRNEGEE